MFPYDNSFQQQCMTDCYNNFSYNCYAPSYCYDATGYTWNYDGANFQNSPVIPTNTLYSYIPDYDSSQKEEIKCVTQTTRGTCSDEDLQLQKEDVAKQEDIVKQEEMEIEINSTQEDKSLRLEQKFGRNIASNIFHNIIKSASTQKQFARLIQSAIQTNKLRITPDGFMAKLTEKTKTLKGYVNIKTIKNLMNGRRIGSTRADLQFSKILRILSRIYINKYHLLHIFHSSKIKRKSRSLHVKRMRKLLKLIM